MKLNLFNLDRSYVFCFREEFHIILIQYNHNILTNPIINYKSNNFLQNKRKIHRFHDLDLNHGKSCIMEYISSMNSNSWKNIIVLFASQFSWLLFQNYADRNDLLPTHNSVQALTLFCENRVTNTCLSVNTQTKDCFHPEILFRIIRQFYKDTCILHLIRLILYCDYYQFQLKTELILKYSQFLNNQLIHFILSELDKFTRKSLYHLSLFINTQSIDYNNIIIGHKWRIFEMQISLKEVFYPYPIIYQSLYAPILYTTHYLRYNHYVLLLLQGNYNCAQNIDRRFTRFYERRICSSKRYLRIARNEFPIQWFKIRLQPKLITQHGRVIEYSKHVPISLEYMMIPVMISNQILINNLRIHTVCNSDGYPLSKINWISLDDIQICGYFQLIYIRLYFYYSGIYNKRIFDYLYYILKYSFIKTIAFKHKKSFRFVLKSQNKLQMFCQIYPIRKTNINSVHSLRIWHLDVIYTIEY